MDEQLREYIDEWRKQRSKEEEELKRLKEKQAKRKEIRAEQEKKLAQQKKEEEERMRKEEADKKAKEAEEKRKRLEEAEKKRQAMMNAQKEKQNNTGKNCVPRSNLTTSFCPLIQASWFLGSLSGGGNRQSHGSAVNVEEGRRERTKTREQLEEEKKISLSIRIKPLDVDSLDSDQLRSKAGELWDTIVRLETEKYDLEERQERQNYDVSLCLITIFQFLE